MPRGFGGEGEHPRKNEILFIDARNLGHLINRRTRELSYEDIQKIADTYHAWINTKPSLSGTTAWMQEVGQRQERLPRGLGEGESAGKKLPEHLLENARKLRKNQTDAETILWQLLRNRQINDCKFRRQHPAEPYILDFYCHEKKIAIELDGGQHNMPSEIANDDKRTRFLQDQELTVLRFWNNEVLQNTEAVLEKIYNALTQTLSQRERAHADIPGFCASVPISRVAELDYVLTPGRYVGLPMEEDDFDFKERFTALKAEFEAQLLEEAALNKTIAENLSKVK